MKDLKKYIFALNLLLLVPLWLGLVAVASAQDQSVCSIQRLAGQWGYSATGTIFLQTGPTPFAIVGKSTLRRDGSSTATQTASLGGNVSQETGGKAFITLNTDCTGTIELNINGEPGVSPDRTATWAIVIDDSGQEIRGIMTSLVLHLPTGDQSTPTVMNMNMRKVFPGSADAR